MKVLVSIEHPAWAHQFKYIIKELQKKGHEVKVVAIRKEVDLELLDSFGIDYELISDSSGKNMFEKGIIFLKTTYRIYIISRSFKPDLFFGRASPMMALNSFLFRKKHLVFEDSEFSTLCLNFCKLFSYKILTSISFNKDLGKKQVRIKAYKELFYLHPNWFKPDSSILAELNLSTEDKFVIVRFISWDAHHDVGQNGITDKLKFVNEIKKYGKVFISSEGPLDSSLQKYAIKIPPEKLHDLLYYANLYVGEGITTASECAVLGTHAILVNTLRTGYTDEEEEKYGLVYNFSDPDTMEEEAFKKTIELLKNPNLRSQGKEKRRKLLSDMIDVNRYMIKLIEQENGLHKIN